MPLHYTKVFALLALLTIGAFLFWLVVGSWWQGESESKIGGLKPALLCPTANRAYRVHMR